MVVDPVAIGLIVIIRTAASDDKGTHVLDSGHRHKKGSVFRL
jgi:hypothetical protein